MTADPPLFGPLPARPALTLVQLYKLRLKRRRLLWRALRKRRQMQVVADRTGAIGAGSILCFVTIRNEMLRLPHFLQHYRALGVDHFLIVDNASDDGSAAYLAAQDDVSLWHTEASYKLSRFGMDWLTWLMVRHGHGHWCLTVDADEILVYPQHQTHNLRALTAEMAANGQLSMGALMIDLYPKGPVQDAPFPPGGDPLQALEWFDAGPHTVERQEPMGNLWIRGGARARVFFDSAYRHAPTLNKVPLVLWNRRYAYVTSTHAALPMALNAVYGDHKISGALLHTKFLPGIAERSQQEKLRGQHFGQPATFEEYYDRIAANPTLWHEGSQRYQGWQQLEALGLIQSGFWGH